jgi:hypothetical protein
MTTRLTDLLIELSDPAKLTAFNTDPAGYTTGRGLSACDLEVLLARDRAGLRKHSQSVDTADPNQQFNRYLLSDLLIEIDPVVELHLEAHDMVAETGPGMVFVDENGLLFRAVALTD